MTAAFAGGWSRMTGIENAQAKLTGLGKTTEEVASIMDSALESVDGTAFSLADSANVAASAVAAGIKPGKDLTKYLKTVAAASAAAGTPLAEMGSILNRVQTNGAAFTEELNQLSDRGLPIWQTLADEMKVPQSELKKMVSEGKVDAATFTRAVETMSGDVAQAMGDTTSGAFANMRNSFSKLGATILTPFQSIFKDVFTTVKEGVGAVSKALEPVIEVVANQIGERVLPVLDRMREAFADGFTIDTGGIAGTFAALLPLIGGLAGMLGPLLARLPLIGGAFAGITGPVGIFAGVLAALFLVDPSTLADGIAGLIPQVTGLLTGLVDKIVEALPSIVEGISSALTESLPILVSGALDLVLALVTAIVGALPTLLDAFTEIVPTLVDAIVTMIPQIVDAVVAFVPKVVTALVAALPQIIDGALQLFLGIVQALVVLVPTLIEALIGLLPVILQSLLTMLPALIEGAIQLFLGLVLGLVGAIPQIIQAIVDLLPLLVATLIELIPQLIVGAIQLFLGLVTGLAQALPEIITALIGILPDLILALIDMIPELIAGAIDLFVAIGQGIVEALPEILDTITNDLGPALVDGILGLGSALLDAGKELMGKVGEGIKNGVSKVGDAVSNAMDWVGGFFPHSPAKRGPFSGAGWRQLAKSGAAITEEFSAGIEAAQRVITMPGIVTAGVASAPSAGSSGGSSTPGAGITQINNFAHEDPAVGVERAGQKLASVARRAGG
jgi:tape measure domain-containing protein